MRAWILLLACFVGCGPAENPVQQPSAVTKEERAQRDLDRVKQIAACADRLEITAVIDAGDRLRRVGPFATSDEALLKSIREALEKVTETHENWSPHSVARNGQFVRIDLICTKTHQAEGLRDVWKGGFSLRSSEGFNAFCPAEEVLRRAQELCATQKEYLDWGEVP
jgi:hypothetical protein